MEEIAKTEQITNNILKVRVQMTKKRVEKRKGQRAGEEEDQGKDHFLMNLKWK